MNRAFPEYKGPMKNRLAAICYICGNEADAGIQIGGGMIGVCNRPGPMGRTHIDVFKKMITKPGKKLVVNEVVIPAVGDEA